MTVMESSMEAHVNSPAVRNPRGGLPATALRRTADVLEWIAGRLRSKSYPTASVYTHAGSARDERTPPPPGILGPEADDPHGAVHDEHPAATSA